MQGKIFEKLYLWRSVPSFLSALGTMIKAWVIERQNTWASIIEIWKNVSLWLILKDKIVRGGWWSKLWWFIYHFVDCNLGVEIFLWEMGGGGGGGGWIKGCWFQNKESSTRGWRKFDADSVFLLLFFTKIAFKSFTCTPISGLLNSFHLPSSNVQNGGKDTHLGFN